MMLRNRTDAYPTSLPKISSIIPTYNSEKTIKKCLTSILSQDYPDLEVLIVDGGSKDKTIDICKNFPVKIISLQKNIVGFSRQIGVDESTGDVCAFIDSDVVLPSETWLSRIVRHFYDDAPFPIAGVFSLGLYEKKLPAHNRLMIVTGPKNPPKIVSIKDYFPVGTGHTIILKNVIHKVGGFRKDLRRGQDFELTDRILRAGYCFIYAEDLKSYHLYADSWLNLIKKMLRTYKIEVMQGYPKNPSLSPKNIMLDLMLIPSFYKALLGFKKDRDWVWLLLPFAHFIRALVVSYYRIVFRKHRTQSSIDKKSDHS